MSKWLKPGITIAALALLAGLLPSTTVDPWHLLNPKKIALMVFALAFIQVLATVLSRLLGPRVGAILTGFFGGLVSSTAVTASLAKKSKLQQNVDSSSELLVFLSATGAMLIEASVLVLTGLSDLHLSLVPILLGPLIATAGMLFYYSRKVSDSRTKSEEIRFELLPLLKLSIFIVSVLLLSKLLQRAFGQYGLMVLTFLVSLFEIHGSVIANVQLHQHEVVDLGLLVNLLALSIFASYLSKLFLIWTLGGPALKKKATKVTAILFIFLLVSWAVSME